MKTFTNFIKKLELQIIKPLPGLASQLKMSPITRKLEMDRLREKKTPRESAVLILFYPHKDEVFTAFIKRPAYQGVHSGQIAFPGGKFEIEDLTLDRTALREANEEVGVNPDQVKLIGNLTKLFIPPSNFNVLPFIGYTLKRPAFIADPVEVDEVLEIEINQLLNPKNNQLKEILHRNQTRVKVPAYTIGNQIIWGATAMIIKELIDVIDS